MRTSNGMKMAVELLGQNKSVKMLALEIADILEKHQDGEKLATEEKFLIGLQYSEFYATGNSNEDYAVASMKRDEFLRILNVDFMELYKATEEIYGRTVTE